MAPRFPLCQLVLAAALLLSCGACQGDDALSDAANLGARNPIIPNQVSGGNPNDPALREGTDREARALTSEEAAAARVERRVRAEALWREAAATQDAERAEEIYAEIAEDYPDYNRAAQARYRQGVAAFRQQDYAVAFDALKAYMRIAPVSRHQKTIERMIFEGGARTIGQEREGLLSIFGTDDRAIDMLTFVAQNFPTGAYPDDALYLLGRHYQEEDEHDIAALTYKDLLQRYPTSEWSYMARLALGDTYLERDQGEPYHAGFVDRDPREKLPNEQAKAFLGPVKSGLVLALEQFETFIRGVGRDPRRRVEYASHLRYAQQRARQIRTSLSQKDARTSRWYAAQGDPNAARLYAESAQRHLQGGVTIPPAGAPPAAGAGRARPVGPLAEPPPEAGSGAAWSGGSPDGAPVEAVPFEDAPYSPPPEDPMGGARVVRDPPPPTDAPVPADSGGAGAPPAG